MALIVQSFTVPEVHDVGVTLPTLIEAYQPYVMIQNLSSTESMYVHTNYQLATPADGYHLYPLQTVRFDIEGSVAFAVGWNGPYSQQEVPPDALQGVYVTFTEPAE